MPTAPGDWVGVEEGREFSEVRSRSKIIESADADKKDMRKKRRPCIYFSVYNDVDESIF